MPASWQYALGTASGLSLKRLHCCPVYGDPVAPRTAFQARLHRASSTYRLSRGQLPGFRKIMQLIGTAESALAEQPVTLLHGGFQAENLLVSSVARIVMTQFHTWRYGDPLIDLANTLVSIRSASLPFSLGVIDCYFSFNMPRKTLQLLAGYAALDLLERYLAVHITGGEGENVVKQQVSLFCQDFDNDKDAGPTWYKVMRKATIER
jgi:aminoglycoside phosphotransferase (APT) family kinase protein